MVSLLLSSSSSFVAALVMIVVLTVSTVYFYKEFSSRFFNDNNNSTTIFSKIPFAPNSVPILGHALLYKKDPVGYLQECTTTLGPIFTLNMAGKHMVMICDQELQQQLAILPESVLSARQAVADIGFEQTLGILNVHEGTSLHKGIIKGYMMTQQQIKHKQNQGKGNDVWIMALRESMQLELQQQQQKQQGSKDGDTVEFFHFIRRVMLRTTIHVFLGSSFLHQWSQFDFIHAFMEFQDTLEDVTAKSVILPKPLALVLLLWPLQRKRLELQRIIEKRLKDIHKIDTTVTNCSNSTTTTTGFWLHALQTEHGYDDGDDSISKIAELIVGLLFAAHKNPAIGAAQSFLFLQQELDHTQKERCRDEAHNLLITNNNNNDTAPTTPPPPPPTTTTTSISFLRRVCLESLRVTAHSIGAVRTVQKDVIVTVNNDNNDNNNNTVHIPKGSNLAFSHIIPNIAPSIWGGGSSSSSSSGKDTTTSTATNTTCSSSSSSFNWNHSISLYQDEYSFTTFSNGIHKCPGQELALQLMMGVVALLLVEYTVELPCDNDIPQLSFERATLAQRTGPVMVTLSERKKTDAVVEAE
ncbi:cytochrome P450 [Nitzschia inconspicua]|uniref:Cytochrome P450 n=1 Tax=Nitzschia inconspicua TaxID=303405 RepID=A0A9K3Q870_9STRA|nr:cytochrome P450 [Nitzschia inconspicua]KAG7373645.1 cytochrome P450 [Nitzschia inconspicua]